MENAEQKKFLEQMAAIQECVVQTALSQYKPDDDIEDLLYEVTYDMLADVFTYIDGYGSACAERMDIINVQTGKGLKQDPFMELHDAIADYLKWEK